MERDLHKWFKWLATSVGLEAICVIQHEGYSSLKGGFHKERSVIHLEWGHR